jgi:hypothetical protein
VADIADLLVVVKPVTQFVAKRFFGAFADADHTGTHRMQGARELPLVQGKRGFN